MKEVVMHRIGRSRALVAAIAAVAALGACGRSTHVDRPAAQAPATTTTQAPSAQPATGDTGVGSSTSDLSAAVDGVDNELKDSDSETSSADQGLSQDEGDPTK
jgi:hypothetical protein